MPKLEVCARARGMAAVLMRHRMPQGRAFAHFSAHSRRVERLRTRPVQALARDSIQRWREAVGGFNLGLFGMARVPVHPPQAGGRKLSAVCGCPVSRSQTTTSGVAAFRRAIDVVGERRHPCYTLRTRQRVR